jgi:hypothetical protein
MRSTALFTAIILVTTTFGAGTVLADDDTVTVCKAGTCDQGTIQAGVNNADPGDTVLVQAGTYSEQITVTNTLDLVAGGDVTIEAPEALQGDSDGRSNLVTIVGETTEAIVTGFTLTGPVDGIDSGIQVKDGATATIEENTILDIRDRGYSDDQSGVGVTVGPIWYAADDSAIGEATIVNNTIRGFQKSAVTASGNGSVAEIHGNDLECAGTTVDGIIAQDAVQFWHDASGEVVDNEIHDCLAYFPDARGSGIHLNTGADDVLIEDNNATGHGAAVAVLTFADYTDPANHEQVENVTVLDNHLHDNRGAFFSARDPGDGLTLHLNRIEDNAFGAANFGDESIDMAYNWWDSPTGPQHYLDNATIDETIRATGALGQPVIGPALTTPLCVDEDCTGFTQVHGDVTDTVSGTLADTVPHGPAFPAS